jgi:hypothetical protein
VRLKGLCEGAVYELWDRETDRRTVIPASTLLHEGFVVEMEAESTVTITFRRV